MKFINPTGKDIRNDAGGAGHFGAGRGNKRHDGVDFAADTGQVVVAFHSGLIPSESLPYGDDLRWRGVSLVNKRIETKMWYLDPYPEVIGAWVEAGQPIGTAQNIGLKYKGVTPHVHVRIVKCDPMLLLDE